METRETKERHTEPVAYIQRTRDWYLALGYDNPYRWAAFDDVPFKRTDRPLAEMRIGIVTTAAPFQPDKGDQGSRRAIQRCGQILRRLFRRYKERSGSPDFPYRH